MKQAGPRQTHLRMGVHETNTLRENAGAGQNGVRVQAVEETPSAERQHLIVRRGKSPVAGIDMKMNPGIPFTDRFRTPVRRGVVDNENLPRWGIVRTQ